MRNKFFFVLSLTSILCWSDSYPARLGSLGYDNLDTDVSDLKYGDLNDFFKGSEKENDKKSSGGSKSKENEIGFKKGSSDAKGVNIKLDIEGLKRFLKEVGLHDIGSYDDGALYGIAKGLATAGFGVVGNEERKYKKGTKTKGAHKISHKDEYNRDNEFYEEDETNGVIKKIGRKGLGFDVDAGGGIKKGYFHHDRDKGLYGREGISNEGKLSKTYEGFSDSQGFDSYFKNK